MCTGRRADYPGCGRGGVGAGNASAAGAPEAAEQIALAVSYLRGQRGVPTLHVVAHSWGTLPAAAFAAAHSAEIRSLTLFGPVVPTPGTPEPTSKRGAWYAMTAQDRLERLHFRGALPPGESLL
jgi:pimeloyl-ACP methyl ester carboxylesterase